MPRGRKVNSSGEKSKQLLLEKAIELFSMHGYHETKISDIVKAANLTQPTFYLYFQSKESLYKDLIEMFKRDFFTIVHDDLDIINKNVVDHIQMTLTNIFKYFSENPNLTKIGFFDSEEAHLLKNEFGRNLFTTLQNIRFALGEVNVNILVDCILGAMERLTLTTLFTNVHTPEQLATEIVKVYFSHEKELV